MRRHWALPGPVTGCLWVWTEEAGAEKLTPGANGVIVEGCCWLLAALNTGVVGAWGYPRCLPR